MYDTFFPGHVWCKNDQSKIAVSAYWYEKKKYYGND